MKPYKSFILILSLTVIFYFLFACNGSPYKVKQFMIQVDSIHVPSVVHANTPFEIAFFGTVGTSGCFSFETFTQSFNNNDVYIEVWGSLDYQASVCPAVMVYLDGRKLSVTITSAGIYTIRINQPDSNPLVKQITVN
jgi:hypothetical protein